MANFGGPIELLTTEDIVSINASLINTFGGFLASYPNLRPDGPGLEYLLAMITYPLGGIDLYPSVVDKAAYTAFYIITRHPFIDTNKRTGMEAAMELLELNGFVTYFQSSEVVKIALDIDLGAIDFTKLRAWIMMNIDIDWGGLS